MKTLILVRHAKTETIHAGINDFERRLKPRGHQDSKIITNQLMKKQVKPDLFVSSKAARAQQTAELFANELDYPIDSIRYEQFLYTGYTTGEFIDYLGKYEEDHDTIMVFGHNPDIAMLAINLTDDNFFHFPTAAAVAISFDVDSWSAISAREGKTKWFIFPKQFKTKEDTKK